MSDYKEEDYILPDDFVDDETPPQDDDDQQIDNNLENQEDPPSQEPGLTEEEKIKIRFNHEDLEIPLSEATELIQKGKNYDKIQSRLQEYETDPRLSFVEELAQENDMSVEEFLQVFQEERAQAQLDQLIQDNIPPELAEEILEARKDRMERQKEKEKEQLQQKEQAEFLEFFEEFKLINGREFMPNKDVIPNDVWEAQAQGIPLRFAYMQFVNKDLQNKLKIYQQNQQNSERSPVGATTSFGSKDNQQVDDFLEGFNSYK